MAVLTSNRPQISAAWLLSISSQIPSHEISTNPSVMVVSRHSASEEMYCRSSSGTRMFSPVLFAVCQLLKASACATQRRG